jgi:hypothetical protein
MMLQTIGGPTEPRAGAVIALWECLGRKTIPAAGERDVPREIADNYYVIHGIGVEMNTSSIGDCRSQRGRAMDVQ